MQYKNERGDVVTLLQGDLKGEVDWDTVHYVLEREGKALESLRRNYGAGAGAGGVDESGDDALLICVALEMDKIDIFRRFASGHVVSQKPLLYEGDNDWFGFLAGDVISSMTRGRANGERLFEEEDVNDEDLDVRKYITEDLGMTITDYKNHSSSDTNGGTATVLENGAVIDSAKLKKHLFSAKKMTDRITGILKDLDDEEGNNGKPT